MTAFLNFQGSDPAIEVKVPSQRAYPEYIAFDGQLYQCRNRASASGDYDFLGPVTMAKGLGDDVAVTGHTNE